MGNMSGELASVESVLEKHLPEQELAEVKRILYGRPARPLDIGEECARSAGDGGYEVAGWVIDAQQEETRPPRKVTIALIQNKIVLPTDAPISEQIAALHARVGGIIENAGKSGAQVLCLQEAWTMPFAFCTREKHPWTQFAEPAETGATTAFLSELAAKYRMVIVSPILERDVEHGCSYRPQGEVPGEDEEEPHPQGGGLQRVNLLHGGEHRPQGVQYCIREDSSQHLLRQTSPTELDDVWRQRGRDRVQPQRNGGGTVRAYVGNRGKKCC